LLAAVIAKNAVGSSWQQVVGGQQGSRVSREEKEAVRTKALTCLLLDPSPAVATQVSFFARRKKLLCACPLTTLASFGGDERIPGERVVCQQSRRRDISGQDVLAVVSNGWTV